MKDLAIVMMLVTFLAVTSGAGMNQTTPVGNTINGSCESNLALNALLIQMLLALQPHLLIQQQRPQQQPHQQPFWPSFGNELFTPPAPPLFVPPIKTTVLTSSIVSTVTDTLSKIVSIWFRNERIPTTLYSTSTRIVTDYTTLTTTVGPNDEPVWLRQRRELHPLLESSFLSEGDISKSIEWSTQPSVLEATTLISVPQEQISVLLTQPRVVEAWSSFLQVLEENS